ncbi:hypothetical protein HYW84_03440 [Candidatus Peregrinibacteria bacterium]|nr:hypothetical protein [Candidatus Peregrinibacteria bacterium]
MSDLMSSPGMLASLIIVLVINAVSLLVLLSMIQVFRSQAQKYRLLLANMGNQEAWGNPGRAQLIAYVALTLAVTTAAIMIFIFQPHYL